MSKTKFLLSSTSYDTEDAVLYLLEKLGGSVKGVRKLMNLMFLLQYERNNNTIVKYLYKHEPITKAEFFVWNSGILSNEVYEVINEKLKIDDNETPAVLSLSEPPLVKLPDQVKERIVYVAKNYGNMMIYELEQKVMGTLEMDENAKTKYNGVLVDSYIKDLSGKKKIKFNFKDLAY